MHSVVTAIALIAVAGVAAQWLAWRFQLPAIVLLLAAGVLAGPVTGLVQPDVQFAGIVQPLIAVAVAIILFEGGLTLNFHQISESAKAVRRIVFLGAPIAFVLGAVNAFYVAELSLWPALIFAGILVVTGPTVIIPLLRQAKLTRRPAAILRWEAILADPVGALLAVFVYEIFLVSSGHHAADALALRVVAALVIGLGGGWFAGRALVRAFVHGHVPEFLKIPVILTVVLVTYALSNAVLEESGLLTVTMLGLALGNSRIASLGEVKRFKETMTILLVSGVFIILTASLEPAALISALDLKTLAFVLVLLLVVRPLSIWLSTIGTGLTFKERLLVGWIAPRGVVAVAVSGLFAGLLASRGIADGERLVPLAFAVVVATVVAHGFSIAPLARALGLSTGGDAGLMIVGSGRFTVALAAKLKERDIPVMISDRNWARLRLARQAGVDTHYGEILSEVAEHTISLTSYSHLLAATDNDDYNALICTNFGPEIGRSNVLQIGRDKAETPESRQLMVTLGGRPFLGSAGGIHALDARVAENWRISATTLSKEYDGEAHAADRPADAVALLVITSGGKLRPDGGARNEALRVGDTIVSLLPPEKAGN
ncbi:cation:proton antiporter [Stappia sp.]|uniref:cation:proton antiporter n=1 Tax=Stappia sp. TaxID=1870903 RepID=UPI003D0D6B54